MTVAGLHRRALARVRMRGGLEWTSMVGLLVLGVVLSTRPTMGDLVPIAVLAGATIAVRLAVVFEFARCNDQGITWRSLFATHAVPWSDVRFVEVGLKEYRDGPFKTRFRPEFCVVVATTDGREHHLLPSIWCSLPQQGDFVAAAGRLCPHDWVFPPDADTPVARNGHRPSGSRVGAPTGRRRRSR